MAEGTVSAVASEVEYRDIEGFPGYRVGDDGSVWSCLKIMGLGYWGGSRRVIGDTWKRIKDCQSGYAGYRKVHLYRDGRAHQITVHLLVLTAFSGPCPDGMEACHDDGNPSNNRLGNLRWDTRSNNHADKIRHGTHDRGEANTRAKLTDAQVVELRREYALGEVTQKELAGRHNMTRQAISDVLSGRRYGHSGGPKTKD